MQVCLHPKGTHLDTCRMAHIINVQSYKMLPSKYLSSTYQKTLHTRQNYCKAHKLSPRHHKQFDKEI